MVGHTLSTDMVDRVRPHRTVQFALLAALVSAPVACKPDAKGAVATPPDPPQTAAQPTDSPPAAVEAPRERDSVEADHVVFIGTARGHRPLDCAIFDTPAAPHRQPPQQMHDATDYPERFGVPFDLVKVLQGPAGPGVPVRPIARDQEEIVEQAHVAFALGRGAFRVDDHTIDPKVYDARYCEELNTLLGAKFLVVHAYPVYVDHGNGPDQPWADLGTDAGKANAGFDTLEEARAHALAIMPNPAARQTP